MAPASEHYPFMDNLDNMRITAITTEATYMYPVYGVTASTSGVLNQPYRYGGGYGVGLGND